MNIPCRLFLGFCLCGMTFFSQCRPDSASSSEVSSISLSLDSLLFREGDLLFRCGIGGESRLVTSISRSSYSHVGILRRGLWGWEVVHAVPGEALPGEEDFLKSESLDLFLAPGRARMALHAQVACPDSVAIHAACYAYDKVLRHCTFDHDYRLNDSTQYYCTELIYRSYLAQGVDLVEDRRHSLPIPTHDNKYVFPSDILESKQVYELSFSGVCN